MLISLCNTTDIPDPGSKGFQVATKRKMLDLFVVHKDGQFFAYLNNCPHTNANLEWQEDQFLDLDNAFIQCSTHHALFEIDSGLCVVGPCAGEILTPVRLTIDQGKIFAELPG